MTEIEKLGEKLAKEAADLLKNCKPEDKLATFKIVSTFYLGIAGKETKADEPNLPNGKGRTFNDLVGPIRQNGGKVQ